MENILTFLKQLDLSEIESKLYLNLLKTGPMSVRDLAETIEIKRTTAYFYIDQLVEKGLISKVISGSRTQIAAIQPDNGLQYLVDKKLETAKNVQKNLHGILATINETFNQAREDSDAKITYPKGQIKYLKGAAGARKIYEEAFKAKEFRSYVKIIEEGIEKLFDDNVASFNEALQNNPHLEMKEILYVYGSQIAIHDAQKLSKNKNYAYKLMPHDMKLTSEDILIFDGNVAIINYKGKISSVVLQSIDHYNNTKEIFDFIWRTLPEITSTSHDNTTQK